MLTLKSIRIRNFRAIKELTFQPKEEGITGIFGANGAGKTSVLTAVMFALYGVRPKDITVAGLRRIGSGEEECSVSVVFSHAGQIVEVIRELKGAKNRPVVNIYVDGQTESMTSSGAADGWMRRRLGVTAEGFLTAFVVRQKELDAFVRALPSERKAIIEKLAGVDTINDALKKAREDEKDSKKTLDALPGSQDQVDNAGADVDFFNNATGEAQESLERVQLTLDALRDERTALMTKLNASRENQTALTRVQNKVNNLTAEIPNLEQQLQRVSYVKDLDEGEDVDTLRQKYQTVNALLSETRTKESNLRAAVNNLQTSKSQLTSSLENKKQRLVSLEESITSDKVSVDAETETAVTRLNEISRKTVQLGGQNSDLNESLQALHDNDDCPTCKTHLANPEALRNQFKDIIKTNQETIDDLLVEQEKLFESTRVLELQKRQLVELDELRDSVKNIETQLAELVEQINVQTPLVAELTKQVTSVEAEQQRVVDLGSKARSLKEDRDLYASLLERKDVAALDLETARREEKELSEAFSVRDFHDIESKLEKTRVDFENASNANTELTSKLTESKIRFETARSNYTRSYEQWNKKKALATAHAAKSLTTDVLEQFRQEVVASIAPEVSDYATSLISDMTNGDFTEVKLDTEFKASLVDAEGVERPVSWLSGGEESAVALALRLAVAFLITGGNPELLWLDEPLTAQDKDRRSAILSMIRKLPINQILMINHAQEAQDIVDYEITLKKGD